MPLEKLAKEHTRIWALWKITENEEALRELLTYPEIVPATITNKEKRLEWIAGRILTQWLLAELGIGYNGIVKDAHGKPSLTGSVFHLSLSHSFPYVAAIIDQENNVGIDLEQPKEKLLRIANRVLAQDEVDDAGDDVIKHCIYWCAKEALIKIYGKKDLVMAENLHIDHFEQGQEGYIVGRIIVPDGERLIPLYYQVFPEFVLVFSKPSNEVTP